MNALKLGPRMTGNLVMAIAAVTVASVIAVRNLVHRATSASPQDAALASQYNRAGNKCSEQGDNARAIVLYTKSLGVVGGDPIVLANRARAFAEIGKSDSAMLDFDASIKTDSTHDEVWRNRATVLLNLGKAREAIGNLSKAISIKSVTTSYELRGYAYLQVNELENAIADETEAVHLNAYNTDALVYRGMALLKLNDVDRAKADFDRAVYLAPKNAWAFFHRARACLVYGDHKEAQKSFATAWKLDSNLVERLSAESEAAQTTSKSSSN